MKKSYLYILIIILIIFIFVYLVYWFLNKSDQPTAYPPTKVALAKVVQASQSHVLTAVGELEAAKQVQVSSEIAGKIRTIHFQSGQFVNSGQLLIQLNDETEQGELAQLKAKFKLTQAVYQRAHDLVKINAVSKEEADNALANRDMALGQIQELNARILQKKIKAPFSGYIGIRHVHQGQYLNIGESIVNLVDTQHLLVNFNLDERVAPSIKIGQILQTEFDAFPDEKFNGRVIAIDPLISKSRTVQIQAQLDNVQSKLKAGMFANIILKKESPTQVQLIPETAVSYTAYGESAYIAVQKGNQLIAQQVKVTTGERNNGLVEVSGLKSTDQVIASGQIKLIDGVAIAIVKQDTLAQSKAPNLKEQNP